jgi:hypothetical protein
MNNLDNIKYFIVFIGYARSGHSIFGSLIDAHKNAAVSHEIRTVDLVIDGQNQDHIIQKIINNTQAYGEHGRLQVNKKAGKTDSYDYTVPNEWQGKFENLAIIGDKSGGLTTRRIHSNFDVLKKIQNTIKYPIKWIHVVRNPFDIITTGCKRKGSKLSDKNIKTFNARCKINKKIIDAVGAENVLTIKHEHLIDNARSALVEICNFLELDPYESFLVNAASIVYNKPHKSRHSIKWSKEHINNLQKVIDRFEFLNGYSY